MSRSSRTSEDDPVVQEISWTIWGRAILIEITKSGLLLVDGSPVEPVDQTRSSLAEVTGLKGSG